MNLQKGPTSFPIQALTIWWKSEDPRELAVLEDLLGRNKQKPSLLLLVPAVSKQKNRIFTMRFLWSC